MDFLMFVPLSELELDIVEANGIEITDWYFNIEELRDEHGDDCEYSIIIFEQFPEISNN